jgi:hypothetical protein
LEVSLDFLEWSTRQNTRRFNNSSRHQFVTDTKGLVLDRFVCPGCKDGHWLDRLTGTINLAAASIARVHKPILDPTANLFQGI